MEKERKDSMNPFSVFPSRDSSGYEERILNIIHSGRPASEIRSELDNYHANDIASAFEKLDPGARRGLYKILGPELTAEIFTYLDDPVSCLRELGPRRAAALLGEMDADEAVDILDELPVSDREALIARMDQESRDDIHLIFSYDEDTIGSRMTTNYVAVPKHSTVKQAMRSLISQAEENDNIDTLYVEDEDGRYYGAIELKDLITAREYTDLNDIISTSYPSVCADEKVADCIERLIDYAEDSIPVLDASGVLIGAITFEDIAEAIDDEMGDDYAKLAGLTAEEDLHEPLKESLKKRLPWLILLLFLAMGVSTVVGLFEGIVSKLALIICFQSLILDMAGNVGTQSLAVTIRVLMDEEISGREKAGFVIKEARVGFVNGLLLGVLAFAAIGLFVCLFKGKSLFYSFAISGCVGISLLAAMVISSLVGVLVPMLFHRLKIDPAVASGPLITTVNDLVAVVTYYGLAGIMLIGILHLA